MVMNQIIPEIIYVSDFFTLFKVKYTSLLKKYF